MIGTYSSIQAKNRTEKFAKDPSMFFNRGKNSEFPVEFGVSLGECGSGGRGKGV